MLKVIRNNKLRRRERGGRERERERVVIDSFPQIPFDHAIGSSSTTTTATTSTTTTATTTPIDQ